MENKLIILKNRNKKLLMKELLEEVLEKSLHPQNYYEIAAHLESLGWNDKRASEIFGVEDVFELAQQLWDMTKGRIIFDSFIEDKRVSSMHYAKSALQSFLRGMIFALPMAISVISMLTLRFSLWSYENLSVELATSIAVGTILSFISVGGFMQAIARRGFFYISQNFYNMAKRFTYFFVKLGYISTIIISIFYIIFNLYYKNFPLNLFMVTILYYFFLSANWLSITIMYILKREITFTVLITAGIGVVWFLFKFINLNIILSQIIALLFVSIVGMLLVVYFFNKAERSMERGIAPSMPKMSIVIYSLKPYFLYGLLYFTFLFIDRVISWSTNNANMPYIIWFRGNYELGLDFALLMLTIPMGFSEVIVNRLMENLELTQRNSLHHEIDILTSQYLRLYLRSMILITITSIASAIGVYCIVVVIKDLFPAMYYAKAMMNNVTYFVFIVGLASYAILVIALTNAVILFSLGQPNFVVNPLVKALIINFIVGFLLTRWMNAYFISGNLKLAMSNSGYAYAVIGLLMGSIYFVAGTTRNVLKVMKDLDYYIYAAS